MFEIGSKVVYPAHGVATVEKVEERKLAGKAQKVYVLRVEDNEMVIMIPEESLQKVGVREVIRERDVAKVMRILRQQRSYTDRDNWNRRQKRYMELIQTGSVFEIAKVFRDLSLLKSHKELSFGERKVLDNARQLIVSEIAQAKGIEAGQAEQMIEKIFS